MWYLNTISWNSAYVQNCHMVYVVYIWIFTTYKVYQQRHQMVFNSSLTLDTSCLLWLSQCIVFQFACSVVLFMFGILLLSLPIVVLPTLPFSSNLFLKEMQTSLSWNWSLWQSPQSSLHHFINYNSLLRCVLLNFITKVLVSGFFFVLFLFFAVESYLPCTWHLPDLMMCFYHKSVTFLSLFSWKH